MNTKKAIQHLKDNGFNVRIRYFRTLPSRSYELKFATPSEIVGKFAKGGRVECLISKEFRDDNKMSKRLTYIYVTGDSKCMDIDEYIPRVGRAIAFENAVKNFPEAKKCLEDANLYSEYREKK